MLTSPLSRRQALQLGGLAALVPLVPQFLAARPAAAADAAARSVAAGAIPRPALSPLALWYGTPAVSWEREALPIGNARLGAKLFGDPAADVVQFNEQSMWGGLNDYDNALAGKPDSAYDTSVTGFGSYRDFGSVTISFEGRTRVTAPGAPTARRHRRASTGPTTATPARSGASTARPPRSSGRPISPPPPRWGRTA